MRVVASFSMESIEPPKASYSDVQKCIETWLSSKGMLSEETRTIRYRDGREAHYTKTEAAADEGNSTVLTLTEPLQSEEGMFLTDVGSVEWDAGVAVSITLASATETLAPQFISVKRPRLITDLLSLPVKWSYKRTSIRKDAISFVGSSGGDSLIELIWDQSRSLPVVAISNEYGADLHPCLADELASSVAGLAVVAKVDQDASWRLTNVKGREWSVYGAAIRLYWPGMDDVGEPFVRHPLWTPARLMHGTTDTAWAASRIQRQISRKIMAASAFAVRRHPMLMRVARSAARQRFENQRKQSKTVEEKDALIGQLEDNVLELMEANESQQEKIARLEATVENQQQTIRYLQREPAVSGGTIEEVQVSPHAPADEPETVADAVAIARVRYQDTIMWGEDVENGIETLAEDAGPPDKIVRYFTVLHDLAKEIAKGPLGQDVVQWVKDHGCICSKESEQINSSPRERQARTWRTDEGKWFYFEKHLKPADAVAPNRCVRIYFEPCLTRNKIIVGWVGRHPGT